MMIWDLYKLPAEELFLFYSRDEVMHEMGKIYENIRKRKITAGKNERLHGL